MDNKLKEITDLLWNNTSLTTLMEGSNKNLESRAKHIRQLIEDREALETMIIEESMKYNSEVEVVKTLSELYTSKNVEIALRNLEKPYNIGDMVRCDFIPDKSIIHSVVEVVHTNPHIYRLAFLRGLVCHTQLTKVGDNDE